MCNCIVSSRGFRLRAFYECKDVHGTYILYSQTINILRKQGRASPPNEPASHPHIAGDISAFSRSPGHNLDETRRESYSCGQPDRIENCIVAFRIEQQRWFFLKSHGG